MIMIHSAYSVLFILALTLGSAPPVSAATFMGRTLIGQENKIHIGPATLEGFNGFLIETTTNRRFKETLEKVRLHGKGQTIFQRVMNRQASAPEISEEGLARFARNAVGASLITIRDSKNAMAPHQIGGWRIFVIVGPKIIGRVDLPNYDVGVREHDPLKRLQAFNLAFNFSTSQYFAGHPEQIDSVRVRLVPLNDQGQIYPQLTMSLNPAESRYFLNLPQPIQRNCQLALENNKD